MEYKHGKKRGKSGHIESISVACSCCFCLKFTLAFEFNAVHKITDRYPGIRTEDDIIVGISSAVVFTSCMLWKKGEAQQKYLICGGTVHCLKVTWNHLSWWAVTCKLLTCFTLIFVCYHQNPQLQITRKWWVKEMQTWSRRKLVLGATKRTKK